MTAEGINRKLTAIFSADVKDYTRLMGQDEVYTIRTLNDHREMFASFIRQYKGRIVDTPGDNILAAFESVSNAVNCAVEIQRGLAERNAEVPSARMMQWRIGISLGDVVEEDGRIYGDGVNIAARVEGLAKPGGICISGTVYGQVKNKLGLEYEDLGEQEVKNIPEPVRIYKVLSYPDTEAHRAVKAKGDVKRKWRNTTLIIAAVIGVGVGSVIIRNYIPQQESLSPKIAKSEKPSIAVLPFENMSGDPENEYFSDGVSEEILNSLVKTNAMPVIARTSSFQYKDKNLNVQKIASELNVTHIMEGSVRKTGNTVRVTAQLVDANTGMHLWSENYDREISNIFALQDEIAAAIVKEIRAHIGEKLVSHVSKARGRIADETAYDIYLKAQQLFRRCDPSRIKAIELFQQAVEKDSEFVDAWVGLSRAYLFDVSAFHREMIPIKIAPLAKAALQRALEIDPENSAALSMLGDIRAFIEYKWLEGSALMQRAVQLSPQDAEINMIYGRYLTFTHQPGAIEVLEKAYRLDPFNPEVVTMYTDSLSAYGRQIDAMQIMESYLVSSDEIDEFLATKIYIGTGNLELAEKHHERAKAIWGPKNPRVMVHEGQLARLRGDDSRSKSIEQELLRRMESEYVVYHSWGSADNLKRRLQLAYQQRQRVFVWTAFGNKPLPFSDEEWQDLRAKMNIAELGEEALTLTGTRTKAEKKALLERRVELDPSVLDKYAGVYALVKGNVTTSIALEISRKAEELWLESPQSGNREIFIAISENTFESLDTKNVELRFVERGINDYDMESTRGQRIDHYRRIND